VQDLVARLNRELFAQPAAGAQTLEERVAREVAAQMEAEGLEPPPAPRAREARLRTPRGVVIPVTVVVQDGDVPPGEVDPVSQLNSPFTNALGQVGFTGGLSTVSGTDNFVWLDDGIVWKNSEKNSDAGGFVLAGSESTMGVSDAGDFVYSPSTDGEDSVWTSSGLLAVAGTQAPGFPAGTVSTFHSRPSMTASGRAVWASGFNESGGTMLPSDGVLLLATDDEVDGDGDGLADATVTDFNASGVIGPGLDLGDSGEIFVEVDLDYGAGELGAVIAFALPACPSLDVFMDGFESGDTSAWDTTVGGA
jgi:hypothetical protein